MPYPGNFNLIAFRGSVTNGTTNTAIAGVNDNTMTKSATGAFLAPPGCRIRGGVAGGVNASRARINTPVLREVGLSYLAPINLTVAQPSPQNFADYGPYGPIPKPSDELSVESTHTDAAPQIQFALMVLTFGRQEPSGQPEHRIRWTSAVTGVVGSWASGAVTLEQNLPSGKYQICGMDVFGTNLLGARLIFNGGGWRPGIVARNAVGGVPHDIWTSGTLGAYGEFDNVNIPQMEYYVEAANTAQEGYWDLKKIG